MAEPKPLASLTSSLLARKGGAKPAMRRQMLGGGMGDLSAMHGHDDLGWNDMGEDDIHYSDPMAVVGLTPMPHIAVVTPAQSFDAPIPMVVEQRLALEERIAAPVEIGAQGSPAADVAEPAPQLQAKAAEPIQIEANDVASVDTPAVVTTAVVGAVRKAKAAFTLRLDPARHLRLRLACAVGNRSAQQIVTQALDEFIDRQPEIEALAKRVPGEAGL
ncbi:hypothetical protein PX699_04825 [Sphingobium sp. H39-3-25]|uniref:hypothetical protein n=1 Tax=Sphingobium arseniciresistens TaxID=3030834 RepID=UPI0023B8C213|nr:hypothetical protein [Sphingobium arseniciresistens]